jgi:hypothetical protein
MALPAAAVSLMYWRPAEGRIRPSAPNLAHTTSDNENETGRFFEPCGAERAHAQNGRDARFCLGAAP